MFIQDGLGSGICFHPCFCLPWLCLLFAVVLPKQFRLQILHASMFLFLVNFPILATPKKPVQQIQRLFVGKEEKGPKL